MKKYSILLLTGFAGVLFACKKTDKDKPTQFVSSPADSATFTSGQTIQFVADFTDNQDLSQYKIDIHDDFDGHGHEKYIAKIWTQIIIKNIAGSSVSENYAIQIPDSTAAGWYHFGITVVDQSGNQSELNLRTIYIKNNADTTKPAVTVNGPTEGFSGSLGASLSLNADIQDNEWIYIMRTVIKRPNSSSNLYQKSDTLSTPETSYNLLKDIPTNGSTWTAGNYELTLTVFDSYFNATVKKVSFTLN